MRLLIVLLAGCGTTPSAPDAPAIPDAHVAALTAVDAAVAPKPPACAPAAAPVATCAAAGADRSAGLKCCVATCGVTIEAASLSARFVSEVGDRVSGEAYVDGLCWTAKPTAPLAEGAQALVFARVPRAGAPVTFAGGWALSQGAAVCFAGPKAGLDPECAGFRAARRQPGFVSLHPHELLRSEARIEKRVQRSLAKRGVETVAEHVTGPDAEIVRRWFDTYRADERGRVPLDQVLLGRPGALLVKWNPPDGRVSQSVQSLGVVRAGKAVLWAYEGDVNEERLWPDLARLMKPQNPASAGGR